MNDNDLLVTVSAVFVFCVATVALILFLTAVFLYFPVLGFALVGALFWRAVIYLREEW